VGMLPLEKVSFDTAGLELEGDRDNIRVWRDRFGDAVLLYFFPVPPDIEVDPHSLVDLREFYRARCAGGSSVIIEVETICADECNAIRTIVKSPQEPSGMAYVGSIILPFRDFSYVVKVQCEEHGTTGVRDAVVFDRMLASGEVKITQAGRLEGWMQDPYDPEWVGRLARNRAEDERFDEEFPDHPLSRVRSVLRQAQGTLRVAPEVKAEPKFVVKDRSKGVPWWRRWLGTR